MSMTNIIILLVWASGVVPGYIHIKKSYTDVKIDWTVDLRATSILFSLILSWFAILWYYISFYHGDRPAKW